MDWAILNGERFAGIYLIALCFGGPKKYSCDLFCYFCCVFLLGLYATASLLVFNASHLLTMHAASIKTWFEKVKPTMKMKAEPHCHYNHE